MRTDERTFAEEFERVLVETDTSVRRLARLSGVPRRTLENWLYGRTLHPRYVEPILEAARALNLPAHDVDKLLRAAGHPTLDSLKQSTGLKNSELLADWQLAPNVLIGQKRAAISVQSTLPQATTPFLGRRADCDALAALLRRPDLRLITVTGLGGVGKTRLAVETASAQVDWFDHGIYFVPLDNVGDPEGFWEAILTGLEIPSDGVYPAQQLVEDYVADKQILLLLDNFEHLLPLATETSDLLAKSRRLKLLVTSRQALELQAEQIYPIGGLSCAEGRDSAAYQLYVQTARRLLPNYRPSAREADDIVTLCSQVDGLPLAIELAGAWRDVLRPAQALAQLHSDLQELLHDAADRPQRQHSLWSLFDYSWQLFSAEQQEAALRLSVMRGTFTTDAAMSVAGCPPAVLRKLIHASFLMLNVDQRLMIHPLVREFLAQKAIHMGYDIAELEDRFIEITLAWTAEQTGELRQTLNVGYFQRLREEWQHVERAWRLALERGYYELLESCWDLIVYFEAGGTWGQGATFFAAARRQVPLTERRMQARLDEAESVFLARQYDIPGSVKLARRALQTLEELGVDTKTSTAGAYARVVLFTADYVLNQRAATEKINQEFKEVAGPGLAKSADAIAAQTGGVACFARGDFAGASAIFEDILSRVGADAFVVPTFHCFLGISLRAEGRPEAARSHFLLALQRGLEIQVYPAVVTATYELRLLQGDNPSTEELRQALESLAEKMGSRRTVGRVAVVNAVQYLNLGLFKRGSRLMRIGAGMLWSEIDAAERRRLISAIAQVYIAFGLIKHAPQILSLIAPRAEAQFDLT